MPFLQLPISEANSVAQLRPYILLQLHKVEEELPGVLGEGNGQAGWYPDRQADW